jgi:putative ABC transport system permease protein
MKIGDSLESAFSALTSNKLRTALTMLGVIIGVGSVIAMIAIGEGTKRKSLENIEVMGANMITVMPDWRRGGNSQGSGTGTLKFEDIDRIRAEVPAVTLMSGAVRSSETIKFGSNSTRGQILGCEPQMALIRNATKMHSGGWFTGEDNALLERKAVLGYQIYDQLFAGANAIGATIKVKGQNYEVVGVVTYKGGSGFQNPDENVYVPLKTAQERLMGKTTIDMISMQVISTDVMTITQTMVEDTLMKTRKSAAGDALFRVFNQGEQIEALQKQNDLLGYLLAGIASVSLLVGGIGIMNIMLVSVTERTREIGLRKALGATKPMIMTQFLFESIMMCVIGGAIGIFLGWVATQLVSKQLQVPPSVSIPSVILAFGFSAFIGLFFGIFPAMRASSLQPIEALRSD